MPKDKFILNKDNLIIPKSKSKVIDIDNNDILLRLGKLRRDQKDYKITLTEARGKLIQISKEINKILDSI
jgi:hypothetical protein